MPKKKNTYRYNTNRRRKWKNANKMPTITCKVMKDAWDVRKSMKKNLADFGLSLNPNKTIPIPGARDKLKPEAREGSKVDASTPKKPAKVFVLNALEDMANVPQDRTVRLSQALLTYCIYMVEKYGDDYKAMARDHQNYYQDTPKQIRKKINLFKSIPEQYQTYIEAKDLEELKPNSTEENTR